MQVRVCYLLALSFLLLLLNACSFNSDEESLVVSGNYPIVYVKRPKNAVFNPVDSITSSNPGTDLFIRNLSSPDSEEKNLTYELTLGKGDVSDPEVSFDGTQIIFSMKCVAASAPACNQDTTWNIWIYDLERKSFSRVIQDFSIANAADDVDPAFLPNNKIVFASTRQKTTFEKRGYIYADEDQRSPATVLHVMDINGNNIEQISFNQSHDRNPTVLSNGKIMFSRWDHVGGRSQLSIYTCNPDGSDLNILYGAHSAGDAFLHPRELSDGRLISTVLPLAGTWESGALMLLDVQNYADTDSPAPWVVDKSRSGQQHATIQAIPLTRSVSRLGRFTTPYPVLDGSQQVLVSFSFMQELAQSASSAEKINSIAETEAPPTFGIYMLNLSDRSLKPIVLANKEFALTDPVAVFPRKEPPIIPRSITFNPGVFTADHAEGIINIRSVYDTDRFGRMGQGVLTPVENAATPIPLIAPTIPALDTRDWVADIASIKDPLITNGDQRPARFIRVTQSVPVPPGYSREALGETDYEMRELVGYAPVEPDGSVKIKVPADVPIAIAVLDKYGRAFENHTNWLQVRPGETLTCNGCHSPAHVESLNRSPIAGNHPNTVLRSKNGAILNAVAQLDETMAETRTRVDESALELTKDIEFKDVWTDLSRRAFPDADITYRYGDLTTTPPTKNVINYPEHIQPIWEASRNVGGQNRACTDCHFGYEASTSAPALSLLGSQVGRMPSYESLLTGQILYGSDGLPLFETVGETKIIRRAASLVNPGYARGSHLVEVIFGEELFADKALVANGLDHSAMLTPAEKRMVVEWIDMGAQYYNDPYDENGNLRDVSKRLSQAQFSNLHLELLGACASCHALTTVGGLPNNTFAKSRYILTRDQISDYYATVSMVTDVDNPDLSLILRLPTTTASHINQLTNQYYMPINSSLYNAIKSWIAGAQQ